ncbi:DPP IV N-terminal domain-containing protein [Actinospongicola halichondriae]|uniref:S9 family peptidase n=1 Tax=Actinospongicola halichondriae TaxID=3236844 RepID=UPI003D49DB7E
MRALTTTDVARRPLPGTVVPTAIRFSPDGSTVTFLAAEDGSLDQRLVAVDVAGLERRVIPTPGVVVAEDDLPLEEKLRRERARELAVGVTRYQWAGSGGRVLVPMADGLWVLDDLDAEPRRIVESGPGTPLLDARLSDDGTLVGFVRGDEVHVADVEAGDVVQVTSGAAGTGRTNGLAEFMAQEEMGRSYGFWFSDDGTHIAFCEVDERHVPTYRIVHQGSDEVGPGAQEDHAYPFAGAANAVVRVGVVPTDGSGSDRPVWLDLDATGIGSDRYVARVDWTPDGAVVVQVENREQSRLDLVRYDITTGEGHLLLSETSDVWINLHDHLRFLADGSFVWASERSGFCHLELRAADGSLVRVLTTGESVVTRVVAVDAETVWFTSTGPTALERHLHRVALDGSGGAERITATPGVHASIVHPGTGHRIDTSSSPTTPPQVVLTRGDGSTAVLHDASTDVRVAELGLAPPVDRIVTAADGTLLHAAVYLPDGPAPHPTVVSVYGGPHAQMLTHSWGPTVALRSQYLRQEGFCVAVVDNRGSTDRGLAFEGALRHRMGTVEVDDQVALVRSLVEDGITDPDRVGIYGWSYGGYMSAMCLARRPEVFAAACAGAPVTDWDGYDTHYTERYMGTPQSNPDGYREGSVMTHVEGLRDRRLLLIHGLIDENVHFRHTARLLNALIRAGIDHELFLFPDERHVPRSEADRSFMEDRIVAFFRDALA